MTVPTFTPPITPSPGLQSKPEMKLFRAEFGDGYSQTTRAGLNHIRDVINLRWEILTQAEMNEIEAFFRERGGDQPFTFTVPGNATAKKWTCHEWSTTALTANLHSIEATFKQDFSL